MTAIGHSNLVNGYDVDKAFSLLGPRNVFEEDTEEARCCLLDCLWQLIQEIGQFICRTCNLICGDHQWYTNETAREIVEQYCQGPERTPELNTKVHALYVELLRRSRGDGSCADGIDASMLVTPVNHQENRVPPETPAPFDRVIEDSEEESSDVEGGTESTSTELSQTQLADESNDPVIARVVAKDAESSESISLPIASQPSLDQAALNSSVVELTFDQVVQDMFATQVSVGNLYSDREKGIGCYELARAFRHIDKERAKGLIQEAIPLLSNPELLSSEMINVLKLQAHLDPLEALHNANRFFCSPIKSILKEVALTSIKDNPKDSTFIALSIGDPLNQEVYHQLIKSHSQSTDLPEKKLAQLAFALNDAGRLGFNDSVRARIAKAQAKEEFAIGLATAEGISDNVQKVKALCEIAEFATDPSDIFAILCGANTIALAEIDLNNKAVMLSNLAKACFKFQNSLYGDVELALTRTRSQYLSDDTLIQLVKDYAHRDESEAQSIIINTMRESQKNKGFLALALVKAKIGEDVEDILSNITYRPDQIKASCAVAKASRDAELQKRLLQRAYKLSTQSGVGLDKMKYLALVAETFSELFGDHEISIPSS